MERVKKKMLGSPAMVLLFLGFAVLLMVPEVSAKRWLVGDGKFWNPNVNYTVWARDKHFYIDDWLFFVYDRNQMNVLEVNKTNYENCIAEHPIHNWTTGAGRDVVPLNVTRHYYFISGNGFCYGGMKLAVRVEKLPPPPKAAPEKAGAPSLSSRGAILLMPVVFAIGAAWDAFIYSR
ncbi:early nodulin-like protein 17 [Lotus japonicus]|uniref:Phytocyanin domain-containing protein n=1 Tax=Lotus japonicus TaxID=34305 RepID=I3S778_LOTJA|nr:early nodulin-like protein 17 [Lotus japonicus]AFK36120.1 unknown [Lotus japonicus]